MKLTRVREHKSYLVFNMMPIIDIVLLLIIFFMFVCRYIAAENFAVRVPDEATNALNETESSDFVTVSVWFDDFEDRLYCAIGAESVDITEGADVMDLASKINTRAADVGEDAVVNLRMNEELVFQQYEDVIKAISISNAKDLSIAAFEKKKE